MHLKKSSGHYRLNLINDNLIKRKLKANEMFIERKRQFGEKVVLLLSQKCTEEMDNTLMSARRISLQRLISLA